MFKIRVSYLWVKQDGERVNPTTWSPGKPKPKSEPAKVFIELGGKGSIVHDENYIDFINKGLISY